MGLVSKAYTFSNGQKSDPTQVNQDFDTIFTLANGNIDGTNIAPDSIQSTNIAPNAVTPDKSEGLPYAVDVLGSSGVVISGITSAKDGTNANKVNVTTGILYAPQTDGSMKRYTPAATNFITSSANATYYLDFNPDGTWSWTTGHSTQTGYVPICSVTSDASSNVSTVTDARPVVQANVNALAQQMRIRNYMGV